MEQEILHKVMGVDVINKLKEIQVELFNKELTRLMKGASYINNSFQLSILIDVSDCMDCDLLYLYLDYYNNLLRNFK